MDISSHITYSKIKRVNTKASEIKCSYQRYFDLSGENAHTVLRIGRLAKKNIESTKAKSCFGLLCSLSPHTTTNQEIVLIIGRLVLNFDVTVRKKKGLDVDKKKYNGLQQQLD